MNKHVIVGGIASISLLLSYVIVMTLLGGPTAAIQQFAALWYLMVPLAIGFGIQVALAQRLRALHTVSAGGASASVAMLACCAHHATDVLPILGLSAVSSLLGTYQKQILIISLFVNVLGIVFLVRKSK